MKSTIPLVAAIAMCFASVHLCHAQSLWQNRRQPYASFYSDSKARNVGDLLTIVVSENTNAENRDQRSLNKNGDSSGNFALSGAAGDSSVDANFDFGTQSKRGFGGSTEFSTERGFQDRITVSVVDVLPNGNLLIGGKRCVMVQGDYRTLVVSGTVRGLDIASNNTVRSQDISDFNMAYEGSGKESRFTEQGWMSKIVNRVWPF